MSERAAGSGVGGYAVASSAIALVSGLVVVATALLRGAGGWPSWGLAGWLVAALPGVVGGTWLALEHGRTGTRFLAVLVASMMVRLGGVAVGVGLAARSGISPWGFLLGAALGYVPLQAFEVWWFHRHASGSTSTLGGARSA